MAYERQEFSAAGERTGEWFLWTQRGSLYDCLHKEALRRSPAASGAYTPTFQIYLKGWARMSTRAVTRRKGLPSFPIYQSVVACFPIGVTTKSSRQIFVTPSFSKSLKYQPRQTAQVLLSYCWCKNLERQEVPSPIRFIS